MNINGRSDESVFIPFSTLQQSMNLGDKIFLVAISILPNYDVEAIIQQAKQIIFQQNEIAPEDPQALGTINIAEMFRTFYLLFMGIDILIWIVGLGTLLAGIIGVSNIMMVTLRNEPRKLVYAAHWVPNHSISFRR